MTTKIDDTTNSVSTDTSTPNQDAITIFNISSNEDREETSVNDLAENMENTFTMPLVIPPTDENIGNKKEEDLKVKVHFIPVGNAPIMKRTKFLVAKTETFASLQGRLRKLIMQPNHITKSSSPLFMYLHTCFVPSLDDNVGDLFDLYHSNQELKVHYSLQEAWG